MKEAVMETIDPVQLLRAARAGDSAALGCLLDSYDRYLTLLARVQIGKRLQRKADASDVVQETFLEVNRQFPNFRGQSEAELIAWMRKILSGQIALTVRRYLGTKGRDANLERDLAVQVDQSSAMLDRGLIASTSTPSQRAVRREQSVLLAEALDRLAEDYREVIVLRNLEQLGFAEVAQRMNRSEDSVQKLWVRALARLQKALGALRG